MNQWGVEKCRKRITALAKRLTRNRDDMTMQEAEALILEAVDDHERELAVDQSKTQVDVIR